MMSYVYLMLNACMYMDSLLQHDEQSCAVNVLHTLKTHFHQQRLSLLKRLVHTAKFEKE